jgi:ribonuclease HI
MPKQKYYVVWLGRQPGVYQTWAECQQQVAGYPGAKYKSFPRRDEAERAFAGEFADYIGAGAKEVPLPSENLAAAGVILDSVSADAACSGNPGDLEYRAVDTRTREELFHRGPFPQGTVNIGEFLAIVHALAWLKKSGRNCPVYSDSRVAIGWVRDRAVNTRLARTSANAPLFDRIARALEWLNDNEQSNPVLKWQTSQWGENPADFGRK